MKHRRKLAAARTQNAVNTRDDGGGARRQDVLDFKKLPQDLKWFSMKIGETYKINIIPFEVKSKLNPSVVNKVVEVGDLDFMLDIFVHRYIGPNEANILCPKKNYGRKCPLCEEVDRLYSADMKDEAKKLQASRRVYMNVQPIVKGEAQPLEILHHSHFLFAKELLDEANACANGDGVVNFADLEDGRVVKFRASAGQFKDSIQAKSFSFLEREEELEDDLVDQAVSFDEALILLSYEDIEAIMNGAEEDDEPAANDEEEEAPKGRRPAARDEEEDAAEEEPPKPKAKARARDDEEEEAPAPKTRPRVEVDDYSTPPKGRRPIDEDDGPSASASSGKGKSSKAAGECPHGHEWGKDCDNFPKDCRKCPHWDACAAAQ